MNSTTKQGTLYLVSTPIGNLEDISLRALRTLKEVALIAAEDTRVSRKLLSHYDIHTPMTSFHRHSLEAKTDELAARLLSGEDIAIVSDAGTPLISDPGGEMVQRAIAVGIEVIHIPGPSAPISALLTSGLARGRFAFDGFPPRPKGDRKAFFEGLREERRTVVLFEAPNRVEATLKDMFQILGDREIALCREITKKFEETYRGTISSALSFLSQNSPRGEYTLVVAGNIEVPAMAEVCETDIGDCLRKAIATGISNRDAINEVAQKLKLPKKIVYRMFIEMDKASSV